MKAGKGKQASKGGRREKREKSEKRETQSQTSVPLSGVCLGKEQKVVKTMPDQASKENKSCRPCRIPSCFWPGKLGVPKSSQWKGFTATPCRTSLSQGETKRFKQAKPSRAKQSKASANSIRCWRPHPKERSRGYAKKRSCRFRHGTRKPGRQEKPMQDINSSELVRRYSEKGAVAGSWRDGRAKDEVVDSTQAGGDDPFPKGKKMNIASHPPSGYGLRKLVGGRSVRRGIVRGRRRGRDAAERLSPVSRGRRPPLA